MAQTDPVDPIAAPVVQQLQDQGYDSVRVEHTWLGRLRILAWLHGQRREIVLHPTSGEILRDLTEPAATYMAQGDGPAAPTRADQVALRDAASLSQAADPMTSSPAPADAAAQGGQTMAGPGDEEPVAPATAVTDQPALADSLP